MGVAARMLGDRAEAEDLAQDVFVKAYHSLGDFHGEAQFATWLYRITANSCLNYRKKRQRERQFKTDLTDLAPFGLNGASSPHAVLERRQLKEQLEKSIRALPEDQRIVLILRDVEGLSYEDIAGCLGIELGTVRSRLHRARMEVQANFKMLCSPDEQRSVAL
jgi:RNA polymerase sigma-70 factor (ECF subfamily)